MALLPSGAAISRRAAALHCVRFHSATCASRVAPKLQCQHHSGDRQHAHARRLQGICPRADMEMDAAVELLCAHLPRADLAALSDELSALGTSEAAKQSAVQVRPCGLKGLGFKPWNPKPVTGPVKPLWRLSVGYTLVCCAAFLPHQQGASAGEVCVVGVCADVPCSGSPVRGWQRGRFVLTLSCSGLRRCACSEEGCTSKTLNLPGFMGFGGSGRTSSPRSSLLRESAVH